MTYPRTAAQARLDAELAAARLRRALLADAEIKAGYRADQPRVPPGSGRESGRWGGLAGAIGSAATAVRLGARSGAFGGAVQTTERAAESVIAPVAAGLHETAAAVGDAVHQATAPLREAPAALDRAIAASPPPVRAFLEAHRPELARAAGALQAAGGLGEGAAGAAILAGAVTTAPEGGLLATGAGAWMVGQGYDDFSTGLTTLISGEAHETGLHAALKGFGFTDDQAEGLTLATAGLSPAAALKLGRRGVDDAVERALLRDALEPFGPALKLTKDGSFWTEPDIMRRGLAWEAYDAARNGLEQLPPGFRTFDSMSRDGVVAVSNKTLDFERDFYKAATPQRVRSRLKKMVDDVADWRPEKSRRQIPDNLHAEERQIHLLVPSRRTTAGQASQLAAARAYARSRGVVLHISHGR